MKFTCNFASTNIFGHKPSGAITFLNAKGQMVGAIKKHPPTVNPPAPDMNSLGAVAPSAIEDWAFATNYEGYPIDTKQVDGGVAVRVGGSVDACKDIVFKDNPSAINYAKQICDYWETGTVPSAPTGVVSSVPESKIVNGGVGSGVVGHHSSRHATFDNEKREMESDSVQGVGANGASYITPQTKGWVGVAETPTDYLDEHLQTGQRRTVKEILNAGTKEGFKKALDTRSATGAKNAAASAVHFKNEAKRHASGMFVKGKKPDLEKASKSANLATGAAVVADASARESDTSPAYDQAIIAHQAAADAHKHARGGVKGDHQSPSRTKEAAHLKSIEDLKGLKATISTVEPEAKKKDKLANSGTSEGAYLAWQSRRGNLLGLMTASDTARFNTRDPKTYQAHTASVAAWSATEKAERSGTAEDHQSAAQLHRTASRLHASIFKKGFEVNPSVRAHNEASIAHGNKAIGKDTIHTPPTGTTTMAEMNRKNWTGD